MTAPDLSCRIAAGEWIGTRSEQQDAHGHGAIELDDGVVAPLVVLADGMGGEVGGRVAAQVAVRAFLEAAGEAPASDVALRLRDALLAANLAIADRVATDPALAGMGCTLIGFAIARGRATWVSVGDSIILRLTETGAVRINADHSMAPSLDEAVRRGEISEEEARNDSRRSVLLAALTGRPLALIDEQSVELGSNDGFIIASDGLLTLSPVALARLAHSPSNPSPGALVSALLAAVRSANAPDQDNATIVAVRTCSDMIRRGRSRAMWVGLLWLLVGIAALAAASFFLLGDRQGGTSASPVPGGSEAAGQASNRREGIPKASSPARPKTERKAKSETPKPVPATKLPAAAGERAPAPATAPAPSTKKAGPAPPAAATSRSPRPAEDAAPDVPPTR
jgi:protein phosphatase